MESTSLVFVSELEDLFDGDGEDLGNAEGEGERGDVAALFQHDDGLARAAYLVGEGLLSHFSMFETEAPDFVVDVGLGHGQLRR
jgi:hypothetical protein